MHTRREVARFVRVLGVIVLVVFAASFDEATHPLEPGVRPRSTDVLTDGSSIWIDDAAVPDALKLEALLSPVSFSASSSASLSRSMTPGAASLSSTLSPTAAAYDVSAVPFAPQAAPEESPCARRGLA